jgi:F0F1-type ATP synthase assembly protein I
VQRFTKFGGGADFCETLPMADQDSPARRPQQSDIDAAGDSDEKRLKKLRKEYLPPGDRSSGEMATAGIELAMILAILAAGGWWADRKLGTSPWLLLLGCAFGIVGGLIRLVRRATRK